MTRQDKAQRVAFFGGSFDPPHLGHLGVAREARAALDLDTVLFAPVGAQPLKPHGATASFADRLAMTRLAVADEPGFAVSLADAPQPSGAPNYTIETLERLRAELGLDSKLFCLMGADSFFGLRRWHRAAEILFVAPLIVASRPGQPIEELRSALPEGLVLEPIEDREMASASLRVFFISDCHGRRAEFYMLPGLDFDVSASAVRAQIRTQVTGRPQSGPRLLPESVADYIRSHNLYR